MELNKDLYEYLLYFVDEKTAINMLSVNKKFHNEELFGRLAKNMKKNYPLFEKFINESWKQFFVRMMNLNSIINEERKIIFVIYGTNVEKIKKIERYITDTLKVKYLNVKNRKIRRSDDIRKSDYCIITERKVDILNNLNAGDIKSIVHGEYFYDNGISVGLKKLIIFMHSDSHETFFPSDLALRTRCKFLKL